MENIKITEENVSYFNQALDVDFLTEKWEVDLYTFCLMMADNWGKEKTKENKDYFKKHNFMKNYY